MKVRREKEFLSFFDEHTGKYVRTGIIKDGKDTGIDPFMSSFPELLDIGIMGYCKHGKKGLCMKAGVECYQNGLYAQNDNMILDDFKHIVKQCKGKTYQFALGGCGDPDQHENFQEMLEICSIAGITVNFTTSGFGMTEKIADICKKYCGAVAISWYRSEYTLRAIKMLLDANVKTNIHYVLNNNSVEEALQRLQNKSFPEGVNAIVFLLHKPVGLGTRDNMIEKKNEDFLKLIKYIQSGESSYKIGFDSCTIPALIDENPEIDMDSMDTCEGARWSAYITADMKMLPCSFDNQEQKWAVNLRDKTIQEAWKSIEFEEFRNYFRTACPSCKHKALCLGGCPIRPEIVLCNRPERTQGTM